MNSMGDSTIVTEEDITELMEPVEETNGSNSSGGDFAPFLAPVEESNRSDSSVDGDCDAPDDSVLDIVINNVTCSFDVGCQLDLMKIATKGVNVEYKTGQPSVTMYLRGESFNMTGKIFPSGKVTCFGANSEDNARLGASTIVKAIRRVGFDAELTDFRVTNVTAVCVVPFNVKIAQFAEKHKVQASYEPELHNAVIFRVEEFTATMNIFSTGKISVTASSTNNVDLAVQHVCPLLSEFKAD